MSAQWDPDYYTTGPGAKLFESITQFDSKKSKPRKPVPVKTSEDAPLEVSFVADLPAEGRLGLTFCPGKQTWGSTANWKRDLDADLDRLEHEYQCDVLVSLMEGHEYRRAKVLDLFEKAESRGIQVIHFPITDDRAPKDDEAYEMLLGRIRRFLDAGKTVILHCRGGRGRTGTTCACVLVTMGDDPETALRRTEDTRRAPTMMCQEDYVYKVAGMKPPGYKTKKVRKGKKGSKKKGKKGKKDKS